MKPSTQQSGFSLVELLVALVVTLIVSGAVYGLLSGGQGAFRKEPALSDRQANIRAAMDMIATDISGAGAGMPRFAQVFAPGLDGPAGGPNAVNGGLTDELMILTDTTGTMPQAICASTATTVDINEDIAPIAVGQSFAIFLDSNRWTVRVATAVATNVGGCAGPHARVTFAAGPAVNVGGVCTAGEVGTTGGGCGAPMTMTPARVVAYRIRYTADGIPFLERQTSEDWNNWQPVFPGVEDLQVRYQNGVSAALAPPNDFIDDPGVVSAAAPTAPTVAELDALVRRVEVTLSARALGAGLTGQSTSVGAGDAVRGQLRTITTLRPVLETMSMPGLPPPYPYRF